MRRVYRATIPVIADRRVVSMTGPILHVAARQEDSVEVWWLHDTDIEPVDRAFQVVGTGHDLASALATHIGSAITPSGNLVWHLFEHG